jgi:diguanylate cyclase (GGDEF)-like protein
MRSILEYLSRQRKTFLTAFALALLVIVGVIDYFTGDEVAVSIFYSLPISLVAWYVGRRWGIFMCILSAAAWLGSDLLLGFQHVPIRLWNATVGLGYFLIVTYALTSLKKALQREKELSRTDSLTGIANGKYFYEVAESELYRSLRYGHPLTLAYLDLDDFKRVNDAFGHLAGDALLRLVAVTLRENLRLTDVVARLGGDEFAILLPETGFNQAKMAGNALRAKLRETLQRQTHPVSSTVSMGVVTWEDSKGTVDELVKAADGLMYSAKNKGKDRVEYGMKRKE